MKTSTTRTPSRKKKNVSEPLSSSALSLPESSLSLPELHSLLLSEVSKVEKKLSMLAGNQKSLAEVQHELTKILLKKTMDDVMIDITGKPPKSNNRPFDIHFDPNRHGEMFEGKLPDGFDEPGVMEMCVDTEQCQIDGKDKFVHDLAKAIHEHLAGLSTEIKASLKEIQMKIITR